jgi:hypothetical protein
MPESATHAELVQALLAFAQQELGSLAELAVREDALRPLRGERPPRNHGYVPDVYATNVPTTSTLIGEAKTRADLETEHSEKQISAFLRYLAQTPSGIFVLGVPLSAGATARRLVGRLNAPFAEAQTRTVVIDGASALR